MKNIKVSFDFDGTLEKLSVQKYAAELIERGIEVWIVTSRFDDETYIKTHFITKDYKDKINKDLYDISNKLNISKERIHFTNFSDKYEWFNDKDFIWHLDDDLIEIRMINEIKNNIRGISYFQNPNWKSKCEKTLNKFLSE